MFLSLGSGLVAGMAHVFSGPDHLAAVAPIALDQRQRTWRTGLMWGLGHSGGVWLLAAVALVFREALPLDQVSAWSERLVGVVLVGIGLWGLHRAMRLRIHSHVHEHDGRRHVHVHVHDEPITDAHPRRHHHTHGAFSIGTLHGLAGTSHLLGVLPALMLPRRVDAIAYVVAFGLGSIVAMTSFSFVLGWLVQHFERFSAGAVRYLLTGTSLAAVAVGCVWLFAST